MTYGHIEIPDKLLAHLRPLLQGKAVKLVVEQMKKHGAKSRKVQTGLLIAPGSAYGLSHRAVVVSLLGSGSCVIFPIAHKSKGELVKAGLPAKLAKALIDRLQILYGDTQNGSTHTSTKRYYRSRPRQR
jgi:hypothetical protein